MNPDEIPICGREPPNVAKQQLIAACRFKRCQAAGKII
jgi:hypothetical protein